MDRQRATELVLITATTLVALLLVLPYLSVILAAILLAYLLGPPHRFLAQYVGKGVGAAALLLGTIFVVMIPFVLLFNVVRTGIADLLDTIRTELAGIADATLVDFVESLFGTGPIVETPTEDFLQSVDVASFLPLVLDAAGSLSEAFVSLTILLFLVYYLLARGDRLLAWLGSVIPLSPSVRSDLYTKADDLLYAVIVGQFAIAVADGVLVGLGLFLTGFSDVIFWTVLSMFLALIPLIGTMVIWIPAAAYLVITGSVVPGALLFAYGVVIVGSVDNVLRPFVGASEAGLSPAVFILGVFSGIALIGVMGVFFGPIALGMVKITYETVARSDAAHGV